MSAPESKTPQGKSIVNFILFEGEEDISGCVLVGGYFGLGRVGYLSINHLIETLEVRKIGFVNTDFIPPFISVSDGKLRAPFELYRHENLIILATHFEPYKYEQRSIAESIVKWARDKNLANIVQIGGLDMRFQSDEEFDACIVKSSHYDQESLGPKLPLMDEGLFVTGPAALVMLYAEFYKIPSILILPFAERSRPDPKAAALAIKTINDTFGIDCNVDPLIDEGKSIEIEEAGAREIAEREELMEDSNTGMFV